MKTFELKRFVRSIATFSAIGFGLLSGIAFVIGSVLEGNTGLAMTGWGLLFASVAVLGMVVRIGFWIIAKRLRNRRLIQPDSARLANPPNRYARRLTQCIEENESEEERREGFGISPYWDCVTGDLEPGGSPWRHHFLQDVYDKLHRHR